MAVQINKGLFIKALQRAVYKTYYAAIVKATPGRGTVADGWDVVATSETVKIVNAEFGDIVAFLEFGTKPHIIEPKNAKSLRWKSGSGDQFAFAKKVHHPGIEARKFIHGVIEDPLVQAKFEAEFEKELKALLI